MAKSGYKKVGTLKSAYAAVKGLSEMKKRKVKTKAQKKKKGRTAGVPKVTRRRMSKYGGIK